MYQFILVTDSYDRAITKCKKVINRPEDESATTDPESNKRRRACKPPAAPATVAPPKGKSILTGKINLNEII